MATAPALAESSWVFCKDFFCSKRGSQPSKSGGGVVKTLRRSNSLSRSIFSTVGSLWIFWVACQVLHSGVHHRRIAIAAPCLLGATTREL